MKEITIRKVMTTDLQTINSNETASAVAQIFDNNSFHHLLVVNDDGCLEGVISSTDMDQTKSGASFFRNPKKEQYDKALLSSLLARDIMTKDVTMLQATDSVRQAYEIFKKNKFHAIPVMSKGKPAGIVTPIDILDHFFN